MARRKAKEEPPAGESPVGVLYTTRQVAELLGTSVRSVQRMIQTGELAAIGNQRYLKVPAEELARWKESELQKARARADARQKERGDKRDA